MKPQSGWIEAFFVVDGALFSAPRLGGAAAPDVMTKGHPAPALSGFFVCMHFRRVSCVPAGIRGANATRYVFRYSPVLDIPTPKSKESNPDDLICPDIPPASSVLANPGRLRERHQH